MFVWCFCHEHRLHNDNFNSCREQIRLPFCLLKKIIIFLSEKKLRRRACLRILDLWKRNIWKNQKSFRNDSELCKERITFVRLTAAPLFPFIFIYPAIPLEESRKYHDFSTFLLSVALNNSLFLYIIFYSTRYCLRRLFRSIFRSYFWKIRSFRGCCGRDLHGCGFFCPRIIYFSRRCYSRERCWNWNDSRVRYFM